MEGLGLTGMRERVTALGGRFSVDGRGGTTLTVVLAAEDGPEEAESQASSRGSSGSSSVRSRLERSGAES